MPGESDLFEARGPEPSSYLRPPVGMRAAAGPYDVATRAHQSRDQADDGVCSPPTDVPEHATQKEYIGRNDVSEGDHRARVLAADLYVCESLIVRCSPRPSGKTRVVLHKDCAPDPSGELCHHTDHVPAVPAAEAEDDRRIVEGVESRTEIRLHHHETAGEGAAGAVVVLVPLRPGTHQASVPSPAGRDGDHRELLQSSAVTTPEPTDPGPVEGCLLCEAERITAWFHEDEVCWIADCEICFVPMVVWRRHGKTPPAEALTHMHRQLARVAEQQLIGSHYVDDNMRKIPDHYHAHARPSGGFFGHGWRR